MPALYPFRDRESVLLTVAIPKRMLLFAWLGGTAVALIVLELLPGKVHRSMPWMVVGWVSLCVFLASRVEAMRLRLRGDSFALRWYWGSSKGTAEEFLGWKPGARSVRESPGAARAGTTGSVETRWKRMTGNDRRYAEGIRVGNGCPRRETRSTARRARPWGLRATGALLASAARPRGRSGTGRWSADGS